MDTRENWVHIFYVSFINSYRWSPFQELIPNPPLRHGHAISIDMAYTATLAHDRGLLSKEEHARLLNLFSRAGLSIDHPTYDDSVVEMGTAAILKTRDGSLRLAVPSPLGQCQFVNEYTVSDLQRVLKVHKGCTERYPRCGAGLEAYVDSSDTGDFTKLSTNGVKEHLSGHTSQNDHVNGNGHAIENGHTNGFNGVKKTSKSASIGKKVQVQDAHHENGGLEDLTNELTKSSLPIEPQTA
jgi:3-dehydroquinate synthase